MNPTRPPVPPHPGRVYPSEAMPNPLYSMHVNAAVAGPSTQRLRSDSAPTSFYPSHLAQQPRAPAPPPIPSKPASLASPSSLPPSLMPGSVGRSVPGLLSSLESSLFFQSRLPPPTLSASPASFLDSSAYSLPDPYAENAPFSRPALPPKPRVQTQTSLKSLTDSAVPKTLPKPFTATKEQIISTSDPRRPSSADEDELVARAMELSLQEPGPVGHSDLENDILVKVLEESLTSINSSAAHDTRARQIISAPRELEIKSNPEPLSASSSSASCSSRSFVETPETSLCPPSSHVDNAEKNWQRNATANTDLEELAKHEQELILAEDEARRRQLEMDEEFARSIALLEADSASSLSAHSPASAGINSDVATPSSDCVSRPLLYNAGSGSTRPSSFPVASPFYQQNSPNLRNSVPPPPIASESRPLPAIAKPLGLLRGYGSYNSVGSPGPAVPPYNQLNRSISAQALLPSVPEGAASSSSSAGRSPTQPNGTPPNNVIPVPHRRDSGSSEANPSTPRGRPKLGLEGLKRALSAGESIGPPPSEVLEENIMTRSDLSPIMGPVSAEEPDEGRMVSNTSPLSPPVVEEELLLGVSFGFNAPPLALVNEPMQGPIPNIITLPYGKCPPLHILAPSWKHLLKLLTRLSDSRIEPTVEALAGTKSDLKLRTVIQFMKVHHSSEDWRAIVYLTIDVPVPPSTPNSFKYTNGDVNTLPYSYTMSPLPALLRAGAGDSNLSKCFTVPTTATNSYPTLPMTLPDFAMYLHAVLEDSRRASNDPSGGLRKLAKMVDTLYPADSLGGLGPELDVPDKRGVGKFFRRALGRGSRESQNQRGGNAERYEFITPFRIDEYR